MNDCVTPVLWSLGDRIVSDCEGTWPLAPALFPVAMLLILTLPVGLVAARWMVR